MATIAWFGTGLMGAGFVEALRKRGENVVVWNRTAAKAQALEALGACAVADPREAAREADRIHVMVSDDAAVDALLDEIADAIRPDAIVVDHTTVSPKPTVARFARMEARGIAFVHAPVFMSPAGTREAQGVMLCSGPRAVFERVETSLTPMASDLWYVGERPDKAAALKLFGNQMLFFVTAGLADGYGLGRAVGLEPVEMHELFSHFTLHAAVQWRGKRMAAGDYTPAFELTMARKDARLMHETGGDLLRILPAIAARMDELIGAGYGDRDLGVLAIDAVPERVRAAASGG